MESLIGPILRFLVYALALRWIRGRKERESEEQRGPADGTGDAGSQ